MTVPNLQQSLFGLTEPLAKSIGVDDLIPLNE